MKNNKKTLSTEGMLHGNTMGSEESHRTRWIYCWKRKGDGKWGRKQRRGVRKKGTKEGNRAYPCGASRDGSEQGRAGTTAWVMLPLLPVKKCQIQAVLQWEDLEICMALQQLSPLCTQHLQWHLDKTPGSSPEAGIP